MAYGSTSPVLLDNPLTEPWGLEVSKKSSTSEASASSCDAPALPFESNSGQTIQGIEEYVSRHFAFHTAGGDAPVAHAATSPAGAGLTSSAVLHREVAVVPPTVLQISQNSLLLSTGWSVYDGSGGAAVSNLGHDYKARFFKAIGIAFEIDYTGLFFTNQIVEELCQMLIDSTGGVLSKAVIYNSGTDAVEAAMKLSRQYYVEKGEPERTYYIAREQSYHGSTLGALGLGLHKARRGPFECLLADIVRHVSACFPYRDRQEGESDEMYIQKKAEELENMFQDIGPKKVIAFVVEPISGATLGCATAVPGYLKAMKKICQRHGALFILDEVMCGMGRTGTTHAWEQEDVTPDIQVMGKGFGAGLAPAAAMMCTQHIVDVLEKGSGNFMHGHTHQGLPLTCAVALEVFKIIRDNKLLNNVIRQGNLLRRLLHESLDKHPNVGDIRGRGLFFGIEFVKDKSNKEPFDPNVRVALKLCEKAKGPGYGIQFYPGQGTIDGTRGDHIIIALPYNITEEKTREVVEVTTKVIEDYFSLSH